MESLLVAIVLISFFAVAFIHLLRLGRKFFKNTNGVSPVTAPLWGLLTLFVLLGLMFGLPKIYSTQAQSGLTVEILAGYNLIVDSNVSSPSTYSPSAATVAGRVCNNTGSDVDNVVLNIGDYNADTPGLYPSRSVGSGTFNADHPALVDGLGSYAFTHEGGRAGLNDATRPLGTLADGECAVQYWTFSYPRCENVAGVAEEPPCSNNPVWGNSVKPEDDLWLNFDVWATGDTVPATDESWTMHFRNEISAMANKIEPNGNPGGQWFNTDPATIKPGGVITTNGILYRIGNVRFGFDNNGDYLPDYNFWVQPIGDASQFDSGCFRLIKTSGVITVAGKTPKNFSFTDQLYFTNAPDPKYPDANRIPTDNTNVVGEVFYTFLAMGATCNASPTPYQEAASGYDNEKFNGDFGAGGVVPVDVDEAEVTIDKIGDPGSITVGKAITYTIPFENKSATQSAGLILYEGAYVNNPLVISDSIPAGAIYRAGSADYTLSGIAVDIRYSTDYGQTFTPTEPTAASVTTIQWWLTEPLPPSASGSATFAIDIPIAYTGPPVLENCAVAQFGTGASFAEACEQTTILGNNTIGNYVWQDDDSQGDIDAGEPPLDNVTVWLYFDATGDGQLGSDDSLLMTTTTGITASGYYTFSNLLNGNYLVVVDKTDPDLPFGYTPTTEDVYAVTLNGADYLDADFGFGPALSVNKTLIGDAYEGRDVTYKIEVSNLRGSDSTAIQGGCVYDVWSASAVDNSNSEWINVPGAIGSPNGTYANVQVQNNPSYLYGNNFDINVTGNITQVEAIYSLYINGTFGDGIEEVFGQIYSETVTPDTSTTPLTTTTFSDTILNPFNNNQGVLSWDITNQLTTWHPQSFENLFVALKVDKLGARSDAPLYLDALGFRITTDQPCTPKTSDTLNPVPLTDVYDASLLEFVSADPSHNAQASGVITWTNIGPLYAGQTKEITVTFKGLEPTGTAETLTNTAIVTNATFATGEQANGGEDTAVTTITNTGYLSGVVWSDVGTAGWVGATGYEAGIDSFIPGVTVTLHYCSGATGSLGNKTCEDNGGSWVTATTTTDANGQYLFEGLLDGYYYVSVADDPSIPVNTTSQQGDPDETGGACSTCDSQWQGDLQFSSLTPFVADDNKIDVNFGYAVDPAIYGTIWQDTNADGNPDPNEPGLDNDASGITVTLLDSTGATVGTTQTDADGNYRFTGLTGGETYTITVNTGTFPAGTWTQTGDPDSTLDDEHALTVAAGEISGSHDFGYRGSSSIGDTIFYDYNGDGDQDTAETGISGVTVYLYNDVNGDGIVNGADSIIATDTTDGNGEYLFENLPPGDWIVVVDNTTLPDDLLQTADIHDGVMDDKTAVTTDGSANVDDADFGYQPFGTASIGDTVWKDMDGNGVQSGSRETGIAAITVTLYLDTNPGDGAFNPALDPEIATLSTDANGNYLFEDLPAGTYFVDVNESDSDLPQDAYGEGYVLSTNNDPLPLTLSVGDAYLAADFGFAPPGAIGNLVYQDNNNNGQYDLGEPGIPGVTVNLYEEGNPTPIDTATTNASGEYTFTGLMPYTYTVRVDTSTLPSAGYTQTGDPDYPADAYEMCTDDTNPDFGGCDSERTDTLNLGQIDFTRDFGYLPPRAIGDTVWLDTNENGVQDDGERGIGGITVTVTLPSGGGSFTTTTDNQGYYSFGSDVLGNTSPDGTFTVSIDPGSTYTYASDPDTGAPDGQASLDISGGYFTDTLDFGLKLNGSLTLSGTVFADLGGTTDTLTDTFTTGDTPYSGITILLYNSTRSLIGSTTTDATGHYTFTGLFGNTDYTVVVQKDSAMQDQTLTARPDGTVTADFSATTDSSLSSRVTVTMGSSSLTDIDFGYYADSAILSVTKSVTPTGAVAPGDTLTYTIRIANTGTLSATGVAISDTIPANTDYVAASLTITPTAAGSISEPTGRLIYVNPITVEAQSAVTLTYRVTLTDPLPSEVETITNTVQMTDTVPVTRTATVTNPVSAADADLTIIKRDHPDPVTAGRTLTYTLVYTNNGPSAAANVFITDTLPVSVTFGGVVSAPLGWSSPVTYNAGPPATLTWFTPTLAYSATDQFVYTVTVNSGESGVITNTVAITTTTPDSDPTNNDADEPTTLYQPIDLSLVKQVNTGTPVVGDVITFTVVLSNAGPGQATNVVISETLPTGYTYGGVITTDGSYSPTAGQWTIATLDADSVATLTLTATVNSSGTYTNTAQVADVDQGDDDSTPGNDDDTEDDQDEAVTNPVQLALISGRVLNDIDDSDTFSTGDTPILNVTISLFADADGDGVPDSSTPVVTTTTVAGGYYTFTNVISGSYVISETNLSGYLSITDTQGLNDDYIPASVEWGDANTGNDFLDAGENPVIGLAKKVDTPTNNGDGTYVVTYTLVAENLGNVVLSSVQITDDLSITFAGADGFSVTAGPTATTPLNGNSSYNGSSDLNLLTGSDSLGVSQVATVTFTVLVTPGNNTGPYTNTATANGDSPDGTPVSDPSDNGSNPDPDDGGDPDEEGENDPTPITFEEGEPVLHLDKQVSPAGSVDPGDTLTYTLCYSNSGTAIAHNTVITDPIPFNTVYVSGSVTTDTGSVEFYNGSNWNAAESTPVMALRWLVGDLTATGDTQCVEFGVTISTTLEATSSGLSVEYSQQGWIVRDGDASGLDIIGYTTPPTVTITPVPTPVLTVTVTPTPAITSTTTPTVTVSPSPTSTAEPTIEPTVEQTAEPTAEPTVEPTVEQTVEPTVEQTAEPTVEPTVEQTAEPTIEPTVEQTAEPTVEPTVEQTEEPTAESTEEALRLTRVIPVAFTGHAGPMINTAGWSIPAAITTTGDPIVPLEQVSFSIVNTATIGSDETDEQTDTVTKPVIRIIDPALSKTADPTRAGPGEIVQFYLTIDNPTADSNAAATNVVVTDPLPLTVDLLDYSLSSIPAGVISSSVVTKNTVPVSHPDVSETTASTITVNIPVLAPGEKVFLTIRTRVNALADPAPLTIDNTASLSFDEGTDRTDSSPTILVPEPPPPDDGDDDDDTVAPTPTPTPAPVVSVPVQPTPTMPVLYLPETGLREMVPSLSSMLPLLALIVAGSMLGAGAWHRSKR